MLALIPGDGFGLPVTSFFGYPPEWELDDLEADPVELRNVDDDPADAGPVCRSPGAAHVERTVARPRVGSRPLHRASTASVQRDATIS